MRLRLLLLALVLLLGAAACGGGDDDGEDASATVTQADTATTTETTAGATTDDDDGDDGDDGDDADDGDGDAEAGAEVFAQAGCGGCHVLAAAGSTGSVGPNLDESDPDEELVIERVTNGMGAMPAFRDQLSEQQIRDVAEYVSESADEDD